MEAYGMTECSGAETITKICDETRYTHIGGVCVNFDMKLKDLPDMNYLSTDVDE
jgi:long-subunit acyl-CoA synthetase (AMP-forming)